MKLKQFTRKDSSGIEVYSNHPSALDQLRYLTRIGVRWAIATSADQRNASGMIQDLHVASGIEISTGEKVAQAKPTPDLFLMAASRLGVRLGDCIVVGDSVWD